MSRAWGRALGMVAVGIVLAAAPVRAQPCGDPDDNGTVDVIDAANVGRAAVGLPSACDASADRCDVDGSGSIDVIDAANVRRAAVGLPASLSCGGPTPTPTVAATPSPTPTVFVPGPPGPSGIEALVRRVDAFVHEALGRLPVGFPITGNEVCDNTDVPGLISTEHDPEFDETILTFDQCVLDGTGLEGELLLEGEDLSIDFTLVASFDDDIDELALVGDDPIMLTNTGSSNDVSFGSLSACFFFAAQDPFDFEFFVSITGLSLPSTGPATSGSIALDARDAGEELDAASRTTLTYDGTTLVDVLVNFRNATTGFFVYDRETGDLTSR